MLKKYLSGLTLFLIHTFNVFAADSFVNHHQGLEINLNVFQLNTSIVDAITGEQLRINYFLHDRIEIINNTSSLLQNEKRIYQNDFRFRLWGTGAGSWYPGIALELGYLNQDEDWLYEGSAERKKNVGGGLIGGTWYFPLFKMNKGYVLAKWAYVLRSNVSNLFIFNCYAHWNLLNHVAIHFGGDIYSAFHDLKYSGFTIGFTYQFDFKNSVKIEQK